MTNSRRRRSTKAQGLVEYALILALVAVSAVAILSAVGSSVSNVFCDVVNTLKNNPGQCTSTGSGSGSSSSSSSPNNNLIVTITQVNSQHAFYTVTNSAGVTVAATVTASDTARLVLTCTNNKCSNAPSVSFPHGDVITVSATYNGASGQATITYP